MEHTLNTIQIYNEYSHTVKILSDFPELNNLDLYPNQGVQCRLMLPDGMKYFEKRFVIGNRRTIYVGMVDKDL